MTRRLPGLAPAIALALGLGTGQPAAAQSIRYVETTTVAGYFPNGALASGAARPGAPGNPTVPPQGLTFEGALVAGNAISSRPPTGNAFRFSFAPTTDTLTFTVQNGAVQSVQSIELLRGRTLLVLARGNSASQPAVLSNLSFNGVPLADIDPSLGGFQSTGTFEYLSFSNLSGLAGWDIAGTLTVAGGSGQAPRVEFILTDQGPDRQLADGSDMLYVIGRPLRTNGDALAGDVTVLSDLVFNQSSPGTYDGSIFGSGQVRKSGPATLTLGGDSGAFTGTTVVSAGRLSLNGTLGGSLSVEPGGVLGGIGTATGAVSIAPNGVIAPGNSIGTLNVGPLNLGGIYEVEYRPLAAGSPLIPVDGGQSLRGRNPLLDPGLDPADQDADLVVVSGAAQIGANARIVLAPRGAAEDFEAALDAPGNTNRQLRYQILRADAGISGRFVALFEAAASIEYLDAGGGAQDIWLVLETPDGPPGVLVSSAPEPFNIPYGVERPRCDARLNGERYCAVVQGSLLRFGLDGSTTQPGDDTSGGLGLAGLAYRFDNNLLLGLAYSLAKGNISVDNGTGSGDITRRGGLIWAEWQDGPIDLRGWLGLYDDTLSSRRDTALGGPALADVSARETTLAVEARRWTELRPGLEISPVIGFEASWLDQDAYTETGAGAENFSAEGTTRESLVSLLGVDVRSQGEFADRPVEWQAALGWTYQFGDVSSTVRGTYQGDPTQTVLSSTGPELSRSSLGLTLGATMAVSDRAAVRVAYTASGSDNWFTNALTVRMSVRF